MKLRSPHLHAAILLGAAAAVPAAAQLSLTSAVDLALRTSPRVRMAQDDVAKAAAALSESRDVYIPSVSGGAGLGYSYGFPLGQPTLFTFTAQSLIFNFSQKDFIRAARSGLSAANLTLMDIRQTVAADAALTFVALQRDQQRESTLAGESAAAERLVQITQDRFDAGRDSSIALTQAKLTAAQIRLARLHAEDETATDRDHLARLTALPAAALTVTESELPPPPSPAQLTLTAGGPIVNPGVQAAYENARSKAEQAYGDSRYLYRPQLIFAAQYSLFSKFNHYDEYYRNFQYNNAGVGIQISIPVLDRAHVAKARESAAEAAHALHEADYARDQLADGRSKTLHAFAELKARQEVAALDESLALQQLAAMQAQLAAPPAAGAQALTPADEQRSRIGERDKYLNVLDATLALRQAQINLLRQDGQLEQWLKNAAASTPSNP